MKLEGHSLSRLAVPLRALIERFTFGALVVASIALLILGKTHDKQLLADGYVDPLPENVDR